MARDGQEVRVGRAPAAGVSVRAWLAGRPCKNCRTITVHADDAALDGLWGLLSRAWDADAGRDDERDT
jgi:hypothetical protein